MEPHGEPLAEGRLHVGLAAQGSLRWLLADVTAICETLRQRRDLSPVAAVALGQMLAGTTLLLRLMTKTPVRLLLDARGDGPLQRVLGEADQAGNVRGMVAEPRVVAAQVAGSDLAVRPVLGAGTLRVIRQYQHNSYTSEVELVEGGLSENLAHFLDQSEQVHSAVLLGVLARPGGISAAGGLVLEALPGADEDLLRALEGRLSRGPAVGRLLEQGPSALLDAVLGDLDREPLETTPLYYRCTCDRQRYLAQLRALPPEDRDYLHLAEGTTEVECAFCGGKFSFTVEELSIPS